LSHSWHLARYLAISLLGKGEAKFENGELVEANEEEKVAA
jgi:hypothetical protein